MDFAPADAELVVEVVPLPPLVALTVLAVPPEATASAPPDAELPVVVSLAVVSPPASVPLLVALSLPPLVALAVLVLPPVAMMSIDVGLLLQAM